MCLSQLNFLGMSSSALIKAKRMELAHKRKKGEVDSKSRLETPNNKETKKSQ